jgi:hypothetical protein
MILALGIGGIVGLYGLAHWLGVVPIFWVFLPVIAGETALAVWTSSRQSQWSRSQLKTISRWVRGAYFAGVAVTALMNLTLINTSSYQSWQNIEPKMRDDPDPELLVNCPLLKGYSVDKVKELYGIASDPLKLEKITPAGTAFQYYLAKYGTWVFFDNQLVVSGVRLDAPFHGTIHGVKIGANENDVRSLMGPPANKFQPLQIVPAGGRPKPITAWVYEPGTPAFVRYDMLDGRVRTIFASSCAAGT